MGDKGRTATSVGSRGGGGRSTGVVDHHPLAELAERQHGVVSARQLAELGYSRPAVSRASAAGRLHRLHRGVYAVGHGCLDWEGRCLAAVLACEPGAMASHVSAGWIWGVLGRRPDRIHVTAPTRRRRRDAPFRLHFAGLAEEDRDRLTGIPVTALPRTLLDLAAVLSSGGLSRALERSEERGRFDLGPVEELLARAGGHPGAGRLRRALALYRPAPFTRSGLERRFLELVEARGLPPPATGYNVGGHELDAYWEAERFAVELDVYETHGSRAAFERDRRRQEDLKLQDVEMVSITGPRLDREPRQALDRVATLLERRRRELR